MDSKTAPRLGKAYFADNQVDDVETRRLVRLASFYDPMSQAFFRKYDLPAKGHRLLEFGFGVGSLFDWFRACIGPAGDILGVDKTLRLTSHPAARIEAGNIFEPREDSGQFDIVHARLLLEHLDQADDALARMTDACSPGGHVLIADLDCACVRAADPLHAAAHGFNAAVTEIRNAIGETGLMDPAFGLSLEKRMLKAGLTGVQTHRFDRIIEGGSDWALFQAENNLIIGQQVGAADAAETVARLMREPGFSYHDQALVYAIGQRPAR